VTYLRVTNKAKFYYISGLKQNQIRSWCIFTTLPSIFEMWWQ